ncbi:alkaline phosphatase family protein [Nocardioides panacis]|uniref:Alkaline phosphatase family protein n=2 Tax=Nocardioides panacis TaxID=2849501 RepID=A0A975T422_9ACTN|nr:alkaline phosphatase family protein [Nocardioides panacis]
MSSPSTGSRVSSRRVVTKLLVFIEENHSLDQMRTQMPYAFGLAKRYGYATDYFALSHPSLPNYVQIAGGQTQGVVDDSDPSTYPLSGHSVFGQAIARGRTAGVFADGMTQPCAPQDEGTEGQDEYVVHHNPWVYFRAEHADCVRYDLPVAALDAAISTGRLPNAGMVVPNQCHNAHDCSLAQADAWFAGYMRKIFAGPDWRSGHLAVVLTADEDDHSQDNKILTVVVHPSQHAHVVHVRLDHYSLTRLYEDVVHAPHLFHAAGAASMSRAFGLPLG